MKWNNSSRNNSANAADDGVNLSESMALVLKESVARRIIVEHRADNPAGAGR